MDGTSISIRFGDAELSRRRGKLRFFVCIFTLPVCSGEEISDLAPMDYGKGIRASMAYVVDHLKTLKDLRK